MITFFSGKDKGRATSKDLASKDPGNYIQKIQRRVYPNDFET